MGMRMGMLDSIKLHVVASQIEKASHGVQGAGRHMWQQGDAIPFVREFNQAITSIEDIVQRNPQAKYHDTILDVAKKAHEFAENAGLGWGRPLPGTPEYDFSVTKQFRFQAANNVQIAAEYLRDAGKQAAAPGVVMASRLGLVGVLGGSAALYATQR